MDFTIHNDYVRMVHVLIIHHKTRLEEEMKSCKNCKKSTVEYGSYCEHCLDEMRFKIKKEN